MSKTISKFDDIIDVRDIIERVEELRTIRDDYQTARDEADEARANVRLHHSDAESFIEALARDYPECDEARQLIAALEKTPALDDDEAQELAGLEAILADLEGNGGDEQWEGNWYPVTLIRDSYLQDYAQELAEDIGAINSDAKWPNNCIDWEKAASELQWDYTSTEIDGITYWYR